MKVRQGSQTWKALTYIMDHPGTNKLMVAHAIGASIAVGMQVISRIIHSGYVQSVGPRGQKELYITPEGIEVIW